VVELPKMSLLYTILTSFLWLWLAGAASAVIIDSDDGTGNTTAPSPDPGWSYVGTRGSLTAVYLGDGWVLTANHVGAGDVTLRGVVYPYVPGTAVRLRNGDGSGADLLVFAIAPYPVMPLLPIATTGPPLGADLILIGNGRNRGAPTSWDANGPPPPGPIFGYEWAVGRSLRWGTNHVEQYPESLVLGTWSFSSFFDPGVSDDEGQAATGDSGGAAFAFEGSEWKLAGLMYGIGTYVGQPAESSLYQQITYAADLALYRDEILDVVGLPEPTGGVPAGVMLILALQRRRARRGTGAHMVGSLPGERRFLQRTVAASTQEAGASGTAVRCGPLR
jgi:hypothetical protein